MIYATRFETMNALLAFLTENCCQGSEAGAQKDVRAADDLPAGARQTRQNFGLKELVMKRLHVHVAVDDLTHSIGIDLALFADSRRWSRPTTPNGCSTTRG